MNARVREMVERAVRPGGQLSFEPSQRRVLGKIAERLVEGTPVSRQQVAQLAQVAEVDQGAVDRFLAGVGERDADGNIVGIAPGLTLTPTRHRLTVGDKKLFTWCALDALIAPIFLNRTVEIASTSPLRKEPVRMRVSPERVTSVSPNDTVVSIVVVDTDKADLSSVAAIWAAFCHNIFFFPTRDEAEQWAQGKGNIEILSLGEAYELAKLTAGAFTPRAMPAPGC